MGRYDDKETHHSVSANIMEAVGRGLLIATAGIVLGAILGTSDIARFGAGMLVGSGVVGAACMIGSACIRNAGCKVREADERQACQAAEIMAFVAMQPLVIQHDTTEHGAATVGHVDRLCRHRAEQAEAGRGRSV
jgi:hypothetical protein